MPGDEPVGVLHTIWDLASTRVSRTGLASAAAGREDGRARIDRSKLASAVCDARTSTVIDGTTRRIVEAACNGP